MSARKRGGLGDDPLDSFLPRQQRRQTAEAAAEPVEVRTERKRSLTVTLPPDLVEELRDAVVHLQRQGQRVVLAGLVEDAVTGHLAKLRKAHGLAGRFPPRGGAALRVGRRVQ